MLNNRTKSQLHNETWSDFVMKSMFKYYLNMTLFFCAQYSAILLYHGVKTTTPFADAHVQKHAMLPAAWEHPVRWGRHVASKSRFKSGWLRRVGCSAADGLQLSKFRLSRQTQTSSCQSRHGRNSASRSWTRATANGVVVLTPWCSRMADILNTCSNNI